MSERKEFEGKTLEDALTEAETALGRRPEEGEYRVEEEKGGLLGRVKVRVILGAEDGADVTPSEPGEPDRVVDRVLGEIWAGIGLDLHHEIEMREETVAVRVEGSDVDRLTANHGELLQASQYLAQKIVSRSEERAYRVEVDAAGFRDQRQSELVQLAERTAEAVRRSGKRALLPPLLPAERRQVHLALAEDPDVATESEGDGLRKRVAIFPKGH